MLRTIFTTPRLVVGIVLLLPFVLCAIAPGTIAPYEPNELVAAPFEKPGGEYLLGTDDVGRDELSRLVWAARADLKISLASTLLAAVVGIAVGLVRRLPRRPRRRRHDAGDRRHAGLPVDPAGAVPDRRGGALGPGHHRRARAALRAGLRTPRAEPWRCRSATAGSSSRASSRAAGACGSCGGTCCPTPSARSWSASRSRPSYALLAAATSRTSASASSCPTRAGATCCSPRSTGSSRPGGRASSPASASRS